MEKDGRAGLEEIPEQAVACFQTLGWAWDLTEGWGGFAQIRHVWASQRWHGGGEKGEKHMNVCQNLHDVGCSSEEGAVESLIGKERGRDGAGQW